MPMLPTLIQFTCRTCWCYASRKLIDPNIEGKIEIPNVSEAIQIFKDKLERAEKKIY